MQFTDIQHLETLIGNGDLQALTTLARNKDCDIGRCAAVALSFLKDQRDEGFTQSRALFETGSFYAKVFALHQSICTAEIIYDETLRAQWLAKWHLMSGWAQDNWCRYLKHYQEATGFFFNGQLREAEARFFVAYREIEKMDYPIGRLRVEFHLGLIHDELGRKDHAHNWLNRSLASAREAGAQVHEARILEHLATRKGQLQSDFEKVVELLKAGRLPEAKSLVLTSCRQRRTKRLTRKSGDEYLGLGLVLQYQKKQHAFAKLYQYTTDPISKEKLLRHLDQLGLLSEDLKVEWQFIKNAHGLNSIQNWDRGQNAEVFGTSIRSGAKGEVAQFIQLIANHSNGLSKAQICKLLWNYEYDPVIHDPRVYKLIVKVRKVVGRKDWLLVDAGTYRINPEFLTASTPA